MKNKSYISNSFSFHLRPEQDFIPYHTSDLTGRRILVLAPHPDDETIACGGSLFMHTTSKDPVKVVFMTNGAKGDPREQDKSRYIQLRKEEAVAASNVLGIEDIEFWPCEDRELLECDGTADQLLELLHNYEPNLVYSPSPMEYHPDHRAAALLLEQAIKKIDNPDFKVAFYEIGQPLRINILVDITPFLEVKKAALECYSSQLKVRSYRDIAIALNRFRSMTLSENITHAEGFFLCRADEITGSNCLKVIRQDWDQILLPVNERWKEGFEEDEKDFMQDAEMKSLDAPLVSIILPTYNRPEMLRRAIESILSQSHQNFEIIVINDGGENVLEFDSSSNTLDSNIIYLNHEKRKGVSAARNTGLKTAKGKYVAYLDDDDFYYPDHLSILVNILEKTGGVVAYTDAHEILHCWINDRYVEIGKSVPYSSSFDPNKLLISNYIPTLNLCHRLEVLENVGFFDETLEIHEDWDLWIRLSQKYDFIHIPKVTAAWTKRTDHTSLSTKNRREIINSLKTIHSRYSGLIPDSKTAEAQHQMVRLHSIDVDISKIRLLIHEQELFHRYFFIKNFVKDKDVLDLECGQGYGSYLLSQSAHTVVGLGSDKNDVKSAFSRFKNENLQFINTSLYDFTIEESSCFDIIICFEFKNINNLKDYVQTVKKHLKFDGVILFYASDKYCAEILPSNGNVINIDELKCVLEETFGHTCYWGQKVYPCSNIFPMSEGEFTTVEEIVAEKETIASYLLSSSRNKEPASFIAAASEEALDERLKTLFGSHFLDISDTLFNHQKNVIDNLLSVIENKDHLKNDIVWEKDHHIENLERVLRDREAYITEVVDGRDRHIGNLEKIIRDKEAFITEAIGGRDRHIENLEKIIRDKEAFITEAIGGRDRHIENLEAILKNKEAFIAKAIPEKDQHIENLETLVAVRGKRIEENLGRIADLEDGLKQKEEMISHLRSENQEEREEFTRRIYDKDVHIRNIESELNQIRNSKVWRWAERFRKGFYDRLLGPFPLLKKGMLSLSLNGLRPFIGKIRSYLRRNREVVSLGLVDSDYDRWMEKHRLTETDIGMISKNIEAFEYQPNISILMPVYDVDQVWLEKAVDSVLQQFYPNWELCIADDASPQGHIKKVLKAYEKRDSRIKVTYLTENRGISGASNAALSLASGEYVALLDNDDELSRDALYECVKLLNQHRDADLIYSDEDKLDGHWRRVEPFFKPDYSPDLLLSMNYICHFSVFRRSLVHEIGGFRTGYEGSQDYDLILRFIEKSSPEKIFHIPKILYHWRKIPGSAAAVVDAKNYAFTAAKKALADYMERNKIPGKVVSGLFLGSYRVKRAILHEKKVSIIIPFKDQAELLEKCVRSILKKTVYTNYEILLVDNRSRKQETFLLLEKFRDEKKIKLLKYDNPFNFSAINNYAVRQAVGEYILLLNNDMEVLSGEWLDSMVEHAQRDKVGAVGAKLLYPNNRIQHAGVVMGIGIASHAFGHLSGEDNGYFGLVNVIRNYCAVTGACLMMKKSLFLSIGGMDESNLSIAYNDVDLCLKMVEKGYLVVYTPYATLYHYESASRGNDNEIGLQEKEPEKYKRIMSERLYMEKKWGKYIKNDPFYNPNLTRNRTDFTLNI